MRTEPWWKCACGALISRTGKAFAAAIKAHREATGCQHGCSIVQVEQGSPLKGPR